MRNLVLASSSPRRRELLAMAGYRFVVDSPDVDETCHLPPAEAVVEIARRKAAACQSHHPGDVILAADTMVVLDGKALGKPVSESDAINMLRRLSGREHLAMTGVCLMNGPACTKVLLSETRVVFEPMTESEIRWYVSTGEPMDKAGPMPFRALQPNGFPPFTAATPMSLACRWRRSEGCFHRSTLGPKGYRINKDGITCAFFHQASVLIWAPQTLWCMLQIRG